MSGPQKDQTSWIDRTAVFARNFVKHPRMLGSIIPSSRFLVNRILKHVNWDNAGVIVEYGPGIGVVTTEILRRMRRDALLIVVETNAEFVQFLRRTYPDARMQVVHGSAADVATILATHGQSRADYIVSGVPFAAMPPEVRDAILAGSQSVLAPTGKFLAFQYSLLSASAMRRYFKQVRLDFEPLNFLPATVYICTV